MFHLPRYSKAAWRKRTRVNFLTPTEIMLAGTRIKLPANGSNITVYMTVEVNFDDGTSVEKVIPINVRLLDNGGLRRWSEA